MSVNTRALSLDILMNVLEEGVYCNTAIHDILKKNPALDTRERAFLSMVTEGTVERCIELDYILDRYSSKPVRKLKPYIRNILRMALFQIKYMDQVPDSAAVNEAVKLTVKKGYGGLRGFVNGVLRSIIRDSGNIVYPDINKEKVKHIAIKYSLPDWLAKHYLSELTVEQTLTTMEYFLNARDVVIRALDDDSKDKIIEGIKERGIEYSEGHIFDYAVRLNNPGRIEELPGFADGLFVVQDESSMIPGHIAVEWIKNNIKNDDMPYKVLDMCAAPGGKTLHVASELGDRVHVDACDVSEHKVRRIAENAKRLGLTNVSEWVNDALVYNAEKEGVYDIVIADLPCSGLGVIAKKPDIKYNTSKNSLKELADIQKNMLNNAAKYVSPGGLLLFSTCTINKLENEHNVELFLDSNKEYELLDIVKVLGDGMTRGLEKAVTDDGMVKVIPGTVQSDGFFVAALKKDR